nr:SDR family oxidoreductase [Moraxella osloensis]
MLLFNNAKKVAVVTGATRGIGKATAIKLGQAGVHVILNGRHENSLNETIQELQSLGISCEGLLFNVCNLHEVGEAFKYIFKTHKCLDILVNNAGILDDALIGMVSKEQIQKTYETNVFGAIYCAQYASRLMAKKKSGSIINLTSIIGTNGNEGQVVYGSSKAAIIGMTKSLAKELASSNIRVNAVAPGFINTDMAHSIPEAIFEERINSIKMQRIGSAEDVANTILFLSSDLSSYVTGQVIGVDGGMLI